MLFDNVNDPLQMKNLVETPKFAKIRNGLDLQLMNELSRIGETAIRPRAYYTKKFGYEGSAQLRDNYANKSYDKVDVVVSPKH